MFTIRHQYIERDSGEVRTERLRADKSIRFLYSAVREHAPTFFKLLTSAGGSRLLGFVNYKSPLGAQISGNKRFPGIPGIHLEECVDDADRLNTLKKIFERKLRYWECRPMPAEPGVIVSPSDSRVIVGSFCGTSGLFVKGKFFDYEELLGRNKREWLHTFLNGDFAVFRLTPEKYHYNHTPVAGKVIDFYEVEGSYHSCNPGAVVTVVTPYSKNKRVVTVIDTDVPEGSKVGVVAMIEVVALMIGEIVQCYCEERYDFPRQVTPGMFLEKGFPKSLYRPGSSTNVLIFQKGRVSFAEDIVRNMYRQDAESRFSKGFGISLVETDIRVRSCIGNAVSSA